MHNLNPFKKMLNCIFGPFYHNKDKMLEKKFIAESKSKGLVVALYFFVKIGEDLGCVAQ